MTVVASGGQYRTYKPLRALLCVDCATLHVRRYVRNEYGRVFVTDEAVLENNPDVLEALDAYRLNPPR